jgi:hypothetical protein
MFRYMKQISAFQNFIRILSLTLLVFSFISVRAGEIRVNNGSTKVTVSPGSYQGVSLSVTISELHYRDIQTPRGTFTELFVSGFGYSNTVGDPKLPDAKKLIEIPLGANPIVTITREEFKEYDLAGCGITYPVIPAQAPVSKNITDASQIPFVVNASTYQLNQWIGSPIIKVTPVGIMRSVNMGRIEISPILYNPVTGKIRVYELLEVNLSFGNADIPSTISLKKNTYSPFFNNLYNQIPNWQRVPESLITSAPVTYVIVSPNTFQNTLQPFIKWKKKKGFKVIEAYTSNPAVGNSTTSIRNYLQGIYDNPPAGYEKPSFVLFVGDVDLVPAWNTNDHPSDMYYCDYTGDNIPEVFYGRFSAEDVTQLQAYIDKTMEYEQYTMPDASFLGKVTMVAGADADHQLTYGNGQINYGTSYYFNSAHNILSHTYLQPEPPGTNYAALIHSDVSNGVAFANYTAHGSEDGWADPEFGIGDIPALQNNHKFCLMVGNCCKAANFGTTCFAEEITRASQKGALGYIGCSDYSYWDEDYFWACGFKAVQTNPPYDPQHIGAFDVTFHDQGEPVSDWFVTMGQMVFGGQLAVEESNSSMKLYYWETYCLMGDPSLMVYYSVPPPVLATYSPATMVGSTSFTINTEPYAYVAMTINDTTLLGAKCADLSGVVNLTFPAISAPDTAMIVITKQNRKPNIGPVTIIPPTGPYVVFSSYTVNDSTGNNNHRADYGESMKLNVTVKNIGVNSTSNVSGTIETADTNIVFTINHFNFGSIPSGGSATGNDAFGLTVMDKVDDQHNVICHLNLTDGTNTWVSTLILTLNAPVLDFGALLIQDPAPGGNGNGVLDPGESATLKITVRNAGHAAATNTIDRLAADPSSVPYILVSNPSYWVGLLDPESTDETYAYFQVSVNGITPAGTIVALDQVLSGGQSNQYTAEEQMNLGIGQTPQYNMTNTTVSTCNAKFYDSGGPAGNYIDDEDFTMTFTAGTSGSQVKAVFSSFDIESESNCGYDWMKVFDGTSSMGEPFGTYCGTDIPASFVSTTGALTFRFHSDYSENFPGWEATISCEGGPLTLLANAFPSDVCEGGSSQLVAVPNGGSGTYTYSWSPVTYLDNPYSKTPIATPQENITYTVTVDDGASVKTSDPIALTLHPLPATPAITDDNGTLVSDAASGNQWYINGAMIPGANGTSYTPAATGTFFVVVTDPSYSCQSLPSNSITLVMTGIETPKEDAYISVYPNPFSDNLTVAYRLKNSSAVKISMLDMFGRETKIPGYDRNLPAGEYSAVLSGNGLAPGMYYILVTTNDYRIIRKVFYVK